jgi:sugar lactone lactonase YvrE
MTKMVGVRLGLALAICSTGGAQQYVISTIADGGSIEGVQGLSTNLQGGPGRIAVDTGGNVFVAMPTDHVVLRFDAETGLLTRVAGNYMQGFSGDGGPATAAQLSLSFLSGIALDSADNLYIADSQNFRIRKVSANGVITTVAGNGSYTYSGDGGPASSKGTAVPVVISIGGVRSNTVTIAVQ